jgi:hypothetical protein
MSATKKIPKSSEPESGRFDILTDDRGHFVRVYDANLGQWRNMSGPHAVLRTAYVVRERMEKRFAEMIDEIEKVNAETAAKDAAKSVLERYPDYRYRPPAPEPTVELCGRCPFCGSPFCSLAEERSGGMQICVVVCKDCSARGPITGSKEGARQMWSRRTKAWDPTTP